MSNRDKVLRYLQTTYPRKSTNSDIRQATRIEPHHQVFQLTQKLMKAGEISGTQIGREWYFQARSSSSQATQPVPAESSAARANGQPARMTASGFEKFAREKFIDSLEANLAPASVPGVRKEWDMVSDDGSIIGDAKYYTLVRGKNIPPAKFATIAEHVWLLEKTNANIKFLVFGNQIDVPTKWLGKYGNLVSDVRFYFLVDDGKITRLK